MFPEIGSRRFGQNGPETLYQSSRFLRSYRLQKFFLPKITHALFVAFIVVVVYRQSDSLKEEKLLFWTFMALHAITMMFFFVASCMDPGYVTRESVKLIMDSLNSTPGTTSDHNGSISEFAVDKEYKDSFSSEDSEDEVFVDPHGSERSASIPLMSSGRGSSPTKRSMNSDYAAPKLSYKDKPVTFRKCNYCEIVQPLRAKHCEECGRCVRKYDHHCPWLGSCVGETNHKFFFLLLSFGLLTCALTIHITYHAFQTPQSYTLSDYLKLNLLLIVAFVLECLFLMVDGVLFCAHAYLMFSNQTTWEFMARHKITYLRELPEDENPFDRGLAKNCWQFLCNCRSRHWELYFTNLSRQATQSCVSQVMIHTANAAATAVSSSAYGGGSSCYPQVTQSSSGGMKKQYSQLRIEDSDDDQYTVEEHEGKEWHPIQCNDVQRNDFDDDDSIFVSGKTPPQSVSLHAAQIIEIDDRVTSAAGEKQWEEIEEGKGREELKNLDDDTRRVDDSGNGESSCSSNPNLNVSNV
ncbi:uncharacterized protein LOC134854400 isoform X2 [Symsagittifera roscoffensis]|uniref:uncharacterized protein LOC134854400 isoform X2 n=1 Tax=Symsagittifera roscoffensis TaxID=84072 RepID=UPI00307B2D2A